MIGNFFRKFSMNGLPNGLALFANEKFRQKSDTELLARLGANTHPYGRVLDGFANGVELYGHLTSVNSNAYYQNNARNINDSFERHWDAFKRATDIDYS